MKITHAFRVLLLLGWLAFAVQHSAAQNGLSWSSLKPLQAPAPQKVLVQGKLLTYYPLEKGQEIEVIVQGPTTLKVLSRIEFGSNSSGEKRYIIHYEREDGKKDDFRRSATAAANAVLQQNQTVYLGNSRDLYLKVPAGKHTYKFFVGEKARYRLYLRFYEQTADVAAQSVNVVYSPLKFTTVVPLIVKEDEAQYYRVGPLDSLTLSVIGPTHIEVLSRLEFDPTMITDQKFRLRAFEDGKEKQIYPLRSKPSEVAEYREVSDKKAGQAAKFYIEVPRGKHEYTFEVVDNGRSVLLRFFLPRKDLGNNL